MAAATWQFPANHKKSIWETMTTTTDDLRLAADFAPATYDDWRKLVDGVLKGAPFEKLVGKTYDGIRIDPIYPRAKGAAPIMGRAAAAPWQIMQRIDHPDAAQANAQALHDLENGATGLTLVFAGANGAQALGSIHRRKRSRRSSTASSSMPASGSNCRSARNRGWPRSMSPNTSSARAFRPRPATSASASIRSAPCAVVGLQPLCLARDRARRDERGEGPRGDGLQGPVRGRRRPGDP